MKIYFDENVAFQIPEALNILQQPCKDEEIEVICISEKFGRGVTDEEWIPEVGKERGVVVTQDLKIQYTRQQRILYEKYNVGVVFFKPPSKKGYTYWEQVINILSSWAEIKKIAIHHKRPFAYIRRPGSKKLIEIT